MDVQALKDAISEDRKAGRQPFAIAATVGTTGTGAVDPLKEISELCKAEKLWLHVDACHGGAARLVPKLQSLFQGIEQADSISIDPHKWFFIPITTEWDLYTMYKLCGNWKTILIDFSPELIPACLSQNQRPQAQHNTGTFLFPSHS